MEDTKIKIGILPNYFLNDDGTFNKDEAILLSGKIAGICYDKEGFSHLENEPIEKTMRRVKNTLNIGHHSVYDHITINFNIKNLPKILAMVINNEHQYTTSEKSGRYTPIVRTDTSVITLREQELYNKWLEIFKFKIKALYGNIYNDSKITKLAQENARYLVTVFMPTEMIYSTTFKQINYIASWLQKYIDTANMNNDFERKLSLSMQEFIVALRNINVLDENLMKNEKDRSISLFGHNIDKLEEIFSNVYITTYEGSLAQYAQAHRHRTLDYQLEFMDEKKYYVPEILKNDGLLVKEWLRDINSVGEVYPNGELVRISEMGKYEDFILKCKERLCTGAQLEIMNQTRETLLKYKEALENANNPLALDIANYTHGARCTFRDYTCLQDCHFIEGKRLVRKI